MTNQKALVLTSGGIDSTTCLAWAVRDLGAENVLALSMFYGQKHQRELQAAADVAKWYQVKHLQLDLSNIFQFSDNALLQGSAKAIPHTDYAEQLATGDGPVSTYVPFRNGVFISVAASVAIAHGATGFTMARTQTMRPALPTQIAARPLTTLWRKQSNRAPAAS